MVLRPFLGVIGRSDIFEIKSFRPSVLPVSYEMLPRFLLEDIELRLDVYLVVVMLCR
jgi:hypothetical protein